MKGLTSIESKLRTLDTVAAEKQRGDYVSVVRYDSITGTVAWPECCNPGGVLLVPEYMSPDEWQAKGVEWVKQLKL